MTTSILFPPVRSILLLAGCAVVAMGYSVQPVLAANPPPTQVPSVVILEVNKNDVKYTQAAGVTAGQGTGQASMNQTSITVVTQHSMQKAALSYNIPIRNNSRFAATNLAVEYHFYNKTAKTTTDAGTIYTVDDITSIETVNIDPGKTVTLTSLDIPYLNSQASNASLAGRAGSKANNTMTHTSVIGWHIEVRFNNKIIAHVDSPDNLQALLKPYYNNR